MLHSAKKGQAYTIHSFNRAGRRRSLYNKVSGSRRWKWIDP
jgi:hypothetical protein